jgi:hypothetical protein
MTLSEKFPPLYECSVCGEAVKVIPQEQGQEPIYKYKCEHRNVPIYANRKVTLRGKGSLNNFQATQVKITLKVRQLLSMITGRSI